MLGHTEDAIQHQIRKDAREAWREVQTQYARRAFTAEFRDGFLDGYIDYLDRGGDAQPPVVPPAKYTRHQKYFTPEGHALLRDYLLGFKYGVDVAVATGQRQYLTVPVLLSEPTGPANRTLPSAGVATPPVVTRTLEPTTAPPQYLSPPRWLNDDPPAGPTAGSAAPSIGALALPAGESVGVKSVPTPRISDTRLPDQVGSDLPPVPALPGTGASEPPAIPRPPSPVIKLPEPPIEVPLLPPGVPGLPMDDRPLPPPEIIDPFPLPPNALEPGPK
jgi:hypothetical protein